MELGGELPASGRGDPPALPNDMPGEAEKAEKSDITRREAPALEERSGEPGEKERGIIGGDVDGAAEWTDA